MVDGVQRNSSINTPLAAPTRERTLVDSQHGKRSGNKLSVGYFTNWGIYTRNFQPSDIIPSTLTHVLYSFGDVDPNSGTISLTDSYADEQKHFDGDSWDETGNNLYGCLKQMYLLKLKNRHLKVLLSIGGWTYSQAGHFSFVTNEAYRATFVSSAVQLVEDYGLDGVDLDFEYPTTPDLGNGFTALLTELRTAFDQLAARKKDSVPYQITIAVSAGAENNANLVVPTINKAVSYWHLMAYDYTGSWSTVSDHQANLYGGDVSGISTDEAVKSYVSRGATASKITMGSIPLYGRGFDQTAGIRESFNGVGPGTWEAGIYDYKDLPLSGAAVIEDKTEVASYSYDASTKQLISYDTPDIVKTKTNYINSNGLAGSMFWSLDSDKQGADSLIRTSVDILGGLDQTQNHLRRVGSSWIVHYIYNCYSYPDSKWTNIANNMGSASGNPSSTTSTSATTTSTSTTSTVPNPTPTGGSCGTAGNWNPTAVYTGGQTAVYGGHLWTAKWWTQGDTPGGSTDVWVDDGACKTTQRRSKSRLFGRVE
ncbi:glycosyl hydrolases family 18-domain-containing protein [Hysterangium stoloniferum]|nr:glycosyl hydrolases family 18-domain-containing protein [Hysterangium stoloniferum]